MRTMRQYEAAQCDFEGEVDAVAAELIRQGKASGWNAIDIARRIVQRRRQERGQEPRELVDWSGAKTGRWEAR